MRVVSSPGVLTALLKERRRKGETVGLVPTMGALHEGHSSLIRAARRQHGVVVVSIFVNPLQFGPSEDFKRYPRPRVPDEDRCRSLKVDYLFRPSVQSMYPDGFSTTVSVAGMEGVLCGASRPGHFRGVSTVVAQLLSIVAPDAAYFGRKDAQQAAVITRMVRDLHMPVRVVVLPTVRDADGLALSSRNAYLSESGRRHALILYRSLERARSLIRKGERRAGVITAAVRRIIRSQAGTRIDYVAVVQARTLKPLARLDGTCLIALAVWVEGTRLIDNIEVKAK